MKMFRIKKYSNFPKQQAKDKVMRTVDSLKVAQVISIELNQALSARYYIETIETDEL
jgi:hypothetical protein